MILDLDHYPELHAHLERELARLEHWLRGPWLDNLNAGELQRLRLVHGALVHLLTPEPERRHGWRQRAIRRARNGRAKP